MFPPGRAAAAAREAAARGLYLSIDYNLLTIKITLSIDIKTYKKDKKIYHNSLTLPY
jgi:hypothetical protein